MARVSRRTKRRTKRRTNRKKNRSIKRDLESSLRKTIERSIKKSLNKFNKRIKKHKKKKTKKKIQRGGSDDERAAGLPLVPGQVQAYGPTAGDPDAVTGEFIKSLHGQYDLMTGRDPNSDNLKKPIKGCQGGEEKLQGVPQELAEEVQRVIQINYRQVLDKLKDDTRKSNDKDAIREYFIKYYPQDKGGVARRVYLTSGGFNIFICDLYIKYNLFDEDNLRIQRKIEAERARAEAAAAAAAATADADAIEAAKQDERDAREKIANAIKIQAAFRGWCARRQRQLEEAATAIQAAYRGNATRRNLAAEEQARQAQQTPEDPPPAPAPPPEPAPPAGPAQQPPESSCLPRPESINEIRKRIQEYKEKLRKCEQDKAELEKQLKELLENIKRGANVAADAAMAALRKQIDDLNEKLRTCEEEKQTLEAQIEELKRKEQDLLKARLCSLLAEIRINKLVEKKDGSDEYVDNHNDVKPEVKRRLQLTDGLFNVGFKYGNLIVMLVTACLLAGVIDQGEAIKILRSEDLLNNQKWITGNFRYAVNYLNNLNILDGEGNFDPTAGSRATDQYNEFSQAADAAEVVERAERDEARAAAAAAELVAPDAAVVLASAASAPAALAGAGDAPAELPAAAVPPPPPPPEDADAVPLAPADAADAA